MQREALPLRLVQVERPLIQPGGDDCLCMVQ
jgi:hypothetical protein